MSKIRRNLTGLHQACKPSPILNTTGGGAAPFFIAMGYRLRVGETAADKELEREEE